MSTDDKPDKAAPAAESAPSEPAAEQPAEEKPAAEQPAAEQPAAAAADAPRQPDLSEEVKEQFKKLEVVLRETAEKFRTQGIHPRVYAASMLEVGILALIHIGADDAKIREVVETLIARNRALRKG